TVLKGRPGKPIVFALSVLTSLIMFTRVQSALNDSQSPIFSRQVGDQQRIRTPVVLDNSLCRLLGVLQRVELGLSNAKGLNELDATMGRIDGLECWDAEKGEANNIRFAVEANGAVGGESRRLARYQQLRRLAQVKSSMAGADISVSDYRVRRQASHQSHADRMLLL